MSKRTFFRFKRYSRLVFITPESLVLRVRSAFFRFFRFLELLLVLLLLELVVLLLLLLVCWGCCAGSDGDGKNEGGRDEGGGSCNCCIRGWVARAFCILSIPNDAIFHFLSFIVFSCLFFSRVFFGKIGWGVPLWRYFCTWTIPKATIAGEQCREQN